MSSTIKRIWSIISSIIVAAIVVFAVFLMGSRLLGFRVFTVISGSMEPEYSVGDLIYVKEVDPATIKVNDVITFLLDENLTVATHRVVEIDAEKQHFYTKGDANKETDSKPVHFNNVIGVPKFSIPKLGYVSDFIQNPPGMYITIGGIVVLVILTFVPDLIGAGEKKEDEKEQETKENSDEIKTEQ